MADSYLSIAAQILKSAGQPMTAQQILERARRYDLIPPRLGGATMEKTLQARIAEDIFLKRASSEFYRTGQGVYYLRSQVERSDLPSKVISEFPTTRRMQALRPYRILHLPAPKIRERRLLPEAEFYERLAHMSSYNYLTEGKDGISPVMNFLAVKRGDRFFSFNYAKYSVFYRYINLRSIGLRSFVDEFDLDLLDNQDNGIFRGVVRLFSRYFNVEGVSDLDIGRIFQKKPAVYDHQANVFATVTVLDLGALSLGEHPTRRRLDIAKPEWISASEIGSGFDAWSRMMSEAQ